MKLSKVFGLVLSVAVIGGFTAGCSFNATVLSSSMIKESVEVKAVGLGVLPEDDSMSEERRHLLAVKASKMDAYRSLVEKVYGVQVSSKINIRSLAIDNDSFKSQVDGLIQMAEIVEVRPILDGGAYETTMSVKLTPEFRNYVLNYAGVGE